ncbi:hypothetical protein [Leptolyngbya sp. AN10]|uniref:hypothetical protein n=1 Tax=Leptolyngbya sp. AN10 TaxID=3423365 RepID=UPI003D323327
MVLPEDDANRQIANGFILYFNNCPIQILPVAGGWRKTIEKLRNIYVSKMRKYSTCTIVLIIDFDEERTRLEYVTQQIPDDLRDRVFVLGVWSEPEKLGRDAKKSFEKIGDSLANDCANDTETMWAHELLKHNKPELLRMIASVKPFLFPA